MDDLLWAISPVLFPISYEVPERSEWDELSLLSPVPRLLSFPISYELSAIPGPPSPVKKMGSLRFTRIFK
jgi:hypothetical protein